MNSYRKLIGNTFIFALGNLGTKIVVFFLVPIYTYNLTKSEFGLTDLIITTVSLLLPMFTLSVFEAVLRFVMDKNFDNKVILNNAFFVFIVGYIILLIFIPLIYQILPFYDYLDYFLLLLFTQGLQTGVGQYVRAQGKIRLFALNGIFNALLILLSNIVLLIAFNLGIMGYLLSYIISYTFSSIILILSTKLWRDITYKKIDFIILREMLRYSIPLIPNSLMWWINSSSNRYFITYFLGLSANGLFAVSNKIPSLLNIVNSIFFQAWQMSAIEEYDSTNKSRFYSNVFNAFSFLMFLATSFILLFLKSFMSILVEKSFFDSWKYVPFLLVGIVFSSFSGFFGTSYIAAKRTIGVFKSSLIGTLVNVLMLFLLVPRIGLHGASLATMMSFFTIWIIRLIDSKEYVKIIVNWKNLILNLVIIFTQIYFLFLELESEYIIQLLLMFLLLIINWTQIKQIIILTKSIVNKKKK